MLTDLELWHKEVESLLENVCFNENEKISLEIPPSLKFKIDGPDDIDSIVQLRNYFNNRIQKRRELLNKLINKGFFLEALKILYKKKIFEFNNFRKFS